MKQMLFASVQFPWPQDNGQKIVSFNDLKTLATFFEIDVISFIDPVNKPKKDEYLDELQGVLPTVHFFDPVNHHILRGDIFKDKLKPFTLSLIQRIPYVVCRYQSNAYIEAFRNAFVNKDYDVIYIDHLQPSFVLKEISITQQNGLSVIYRMHDAFYQTLIAYTSELGTNPISVATKIDFSISKSYEKQLWMRSNYILPVTRKLGELVSMELPILKPKILYFPVSVDLIENAKIDFESKLQVLYIGTVHYPPNQLGLEWFLNECWPLVLDKYPRATLEIVGRGGEKLFPVHPSVQIKEYVEDLVTSYQDADVFIVPLFAGSGIRLKILDALNHGLPIVSTTAGYAGLELNESYDIYVADSASDFADSICELLGSKTKREILSKNGRNFIASHHSIGQAESAISELVSRLEKGDN